MVSTLMYTVVIFVGQTGSLLWFDTKTDGLHAREASNLNLAIPSSKVGVGMPDGGVQKYVFDSKNSRLLLLGVDGEFYSVDDAGHAELTDKKVVADHKANNPAHTKMNVQNRLSEIAQGSPRIRLDNDGDERFILHVDTYSKVLLKASLLEIDLPEPAGAILLHWDKLGPTGKQLLTRIARNGSELWTVHVAALVPKPVLPNASINLIKTVVEGSDIILFLEESTDRSQDHLTHVCRLDGRSGRSIWSKPLKN